MDLDVVYEDEHLLVIDKPAGLVVHPAPGNWSGTLLNGLLARDPRAALLPRAGIVHRLDKDTSGLMVVARTRAAMDALVQRDRGARGRRASTWRWPTAPGRAPARRHVDAPIGRDPRNRLRMAVVDLTPSGKPASTLVRAAAGRSEPGCWVRCHAAKPAARTRSASTWRISAIRWWATSSTAALRRPEWRGRRFMPTGSAFEHPGHRPDARVSRAAAAGSAAGPGFLGPALQWRLNGSRARPRQPARACAAPRVARGAANRQSPLFSPLISL